MGTCFLSWLYYFQFCEWLYHNRCPEAYTLYIEEQYFKKNSLTLAFHSCNLIFVFVGIIILLFIWFFSIFKVGFLTVRVVRHRDRLSREAKCPIPGSVQIQTWRNLRKCPCPQHGFGMKLSLKSLPTQTFPWSCHWDFMDFYHSKGSLVFSVFPWMLQLLITIRRIIKDAKHLSFWDLVYKKEKILNSRSYGCVRHFRLPLLSF